MITSITKLTGVNMIQNAVQKLVKKLILVLDADFLMQGKNLRNITKECCRVITEKQRRLLRKVVFLAPGAASPVANGDHRKQK